MENCQSQGVAKTSFRFLKNCGLELIIFKTTKATQHIRFLFGNFYWFASSSLHSKTKPAKSMVLPEISHHSKTWDPQKFTSPGDPNDRLPAGAGVRVPAGAAVPAGRVVGVGLGEVFFCGSTLGKGDDFYFGGGWIYLVGCWKHLNP